MITPLQIDKMSRAEKLQLMEALWADLSKNDKDIESPAWHRAALEETEARLDSGQEKVLDWEDAKRDLRKRFE